MAAATVAAARSVLLVDDDRDFAEGLANLLALEGYRVSIAGTAPQALAAAAGADFGIGLIDLRLGADSGVDLLRELGALRPELISIILTAYASMETTIQALQAGAYDYLCKPFHAEELLATLGRCVERRLLVEQRKAAVREIRARNRDLETVNARLAAVVAGMRELSTVDRAAAVSRRLLEIMLRTLALDSAALYLRGSAPGQFRLAEATAPDFPPLLAQPWPPPDAADAPPGPVPSPEALILPLAGGAQDPWGLLALRAAPERELGRQDLELGQILASFGAEVARATAAVERLTASEGRLRKLVDYSPSAIAFEDPAGGVLLLNQPYRELFGDARAAQLVPGAEVLAVGRAMTQEVEIAVPAGPRRVLLTRFPLFDESAAPIGVGTIGTDMTEHYEAKERLQRAERLEAMGRLTGGIAHDFNNLLAVVLGNLRLVQEDVRDRPEVLDLVDDAIEATLSGVKLTDRLLAVGRDQKLHPEVIELRELLTRTARLLDRAVGETVEVVLDLAPEMARVCCDRAQLESSLLNLALNARDAMPGGGRLVIAARNACGDAAPAAAGLGEFVAISMADEGHGMSAEIRARAMQPFFTTKRDRGGSGLGLSIVDGFVRQSGGQLEIASAPGHGTTVTLYLPRRTEDDTASAPPAAPAREAADSAGERVLVVEDQPRVRRLVMRQLRRLGYAAEDVGDAASALARLQHAPEVAVLLSDVILPGPMNGAQLCEAATALRPQLGVVLMTGYAAAALSDLRGRLAAVPLLRKPFAPAALADALRDAIEGVAAR